MKFIDEAIIHVQAGNGGPGAATFRREKYVPFGGPDGGNGGAGGSVILVADRNKHTLLDFKFKPRWAAGDGMKGQGSGKDGRGGEDLRMLVPPGTQIFREDNGELVVDLKEDGQEFVLAKGGRGGKGNTFFKSSTNQAPDYSQPGEEGETGTYLFSLKLVADVGLVGFPNAGKSTLISRISAAKPKIADYPFTTLEPNLGVVRAKGNRTFVVADIPGLIPGAHEGKGLGIQFLKHIERTGIIAHLIDPNQLDDSGEPIPAMQCFEMINAELAAFSPELAEKAQLVVLTKADTISDLEAHEATRQQFIDQGHQCLCISSVSGAGLEELIEVLAQKVGKQRAEVLEQQIEEAEEDSSTEGQN